MANILNSTKAAELIEAAVAPRRCSRQNLEKLCERGALVDSPCIVQKKPWRLDGDLVVAEYLAKVSPHQAEAEQPRAKRERPAAVAAPPARRPAALAALDPETPNYNEERALHEREKRLLAQLERLEKEGELIYKADFEIARNAVASQIMNRAEVLPRQIKQVIPHLLTEEMEKIERLVKEMLEGVANWSYEEVEEE